MNQIVMMDKIEDFNEAVRDLEPRANNWLLKRALRAEPRYIWAVGDKLEKLACMPLQLSVDEVIALLNHIKRGYGLASVDEQVVNKIEVASEARRLVKLYAEIHDVEQIGELRFRWPRQDKDMVTA